MLQTNYLALDIGTVRIGLAVGSIVPFGRGTIEIGDKAKAIERIKDIIEHDHIQTLIVGVPQVKSGDITDSHAHALTWINWLKESFPTLSVETVNEAYTSVAAERELRQAGVATEEHKSAVDERSAELILSQFLSEQTENI